MTGWTWFAFSLVRAIATIAVMRLTLAAAKDRWVLPAYTGPRSPQTPVRIPSREEVNHMTDEISESPAEAEEAQAEEAQTDENADEATDGTDDE